MADGSAISLVRTWSLVGLVTLLLFLLLDFAFSPSLAPHPDASAQELPAQRNPYLEGEQGWYELKPNFDGMYQWGTTSYSVVTDEQGFRKESAGVLSEQASVVFLGDSFTFGINGAWQDSFVGMFAKDSQERVINAGVSSYSPTAYLHQYQKLVASGRVMPGHRVVVGLDISDVQDEARYWMDGPKHPVKRNFQPSPDPAKAGIVRNRMRFSIMLYRLMRYGIDYYRPQPEDVYTRARSAFTWQDWAELDGDSDAVSGAPAEGSYAPLGVAQGLKRINAKLQDLAAFVSQQDGQMYLLIYPWPAQLEFDSHFSWSDFAKAVCIDIACAGIVDAWPGFLAAKNHATEQHWYKRLFVDGDVHYNRAGNRVVADALINALVTKKPAVRADQLVRSIK